MTCLELECEQRETNDLPQCYNLHIDTIEEEYGYLIAVLRNKGNGKYYDGNDVYSDEKEMYIMMTIWC